MSVRHPIEPLLYGLGKAPKYSATNSARGCDDAFRIKYTCVFLSGPPVLLHYACPIRWIAFRIFFFFNHTLKIDLLLSGKMSNWIRIITIHNCSYNIK